jgi:hypothetical protein
MTAQARWWWLTATLITMAACGGSTPAPSAPSAPQSFLSGTWSGTLTIEGEGEATTSGPTSWAFETVAGTNLQTFRVTIRSQHPWLPITTTVTSAMTPSNTPPARLSTQGDDASPRGCTGTLLSVGTADVPSMDADVSGVDCLTLAHSTFRGHVMLTKTGA